MRIKLKPIKLNKRDAVVAQGGKAQDLARVLVIAQLENDTLYKACNVAATGWPADLHRSRYLREKKSLYNWANGDGKNISKTPDNLDSKTGKKRKNEAAKWYGQTWKNHVGDAVWNRAVEVFDQVWSMYQDDTANGIDASYWWDENSANVVREAHSNTTLKIKATRPKTKSLRWFTLTAIASIILLTMLIDRNKSKPNIHIEPYTLSTKISYEAYFKFYHNHDGRKIALDVHPETIGWSSSLRDKGSGALLTLLNRPISP